MPRKRKTPKYNPLTHGPRRYSGHAPGWKVQKTAFPRGAVKDDDLPYFFVPPEVMFQEEHTPAPRNAEWYKRLIDKREAAQS